jgi:CheY-like chemotaxis protein
VILSKCKKNLLSSYILVAEDDVDDQLLLQEALDICACKLPVRFFKNGMAVTEFLATNDEPPSLIFLDINMPKMDGIATLGWIRNRYTYRDIPVVMLTTSSSRLEHRRSILAGADRFYPKPSSFDQLLAIVRTVLEQFIFPVNS